jgi:site-specific DNA recombinase
MRSCTRCHTVRKGKRYRYYVTHPDEVVDNIPAWRLPAYDIEKRVIGALVDFLQDHRAIRKLVGTSDASQLSLALSRCQDAAVRVQTSAYHRRTKVPALIQRVEVGNDTIGSRLSPNGFADMLGCPFDAERLPKLTARITRMRKGCEIRLVLTDEDASDHDDTLVALVREAISTRNEVLSDPTRGICQLAAATGRCSKRMTRLLRLSWIAPEIVAAIGLDRPEGCSRVLSPIPLKTN